MQTEFCISGTNEASLLHTVAFESVHLRRTRVLQRRESRPFRLFVLKLVGPRAGTLPFALTPPAALFPVVSGKIPTTGLVV